MTTENQQQPTKSQRFIAYPYIAGIIAVILITLLGTGYFFWYVPSVNEALKKSAEQPMKTDVPASESTVAPTPAKFMEPAIMPPPKIQTTTLPASLVGLLHSVNNQIAVIQLLLANQQFPAALNLLEALQNDAALLPASMQNIWQTAIETDRENIQETQAVIGQLEGQLQQLEHYLNQQLLERLAQQDANAEAVSHLPAAETESVDTPWTTAVWNKIKKWLREGVEVKHKNKNQVINEPNFYTAIMLQMALQRAQFALEQGNWPEYQLTLSSLQTWVTPNLLTWLPDAPGMIKTITELAEQPTPFANANVNATQQALNNLLQESNL